MSFTQDFGLIPALQSQPPPFPPPIPVYHNLHVFNVRSSVCSMLDKLVFPLSLSLSLSLSFVPFRRVEPCSSRWRGCRSLRSYTVTCRMTTSLQRSPSTTKLDVEDPPPPILTPPSFSFQFFFPFYFPVRFLRTVFNAPPTSLILFLSLSPFILLLLLLLSLCI